jgi:hypothetical protein
MYIVRDTMFLKFGHFRDAKTLMEEAERKQLMPQAASRRILSDFTGDAYRFILEMGFNSLVEYEEFLQASMARYEWKQWYEQFKQHVERSEREILRVVM